jgi:hypothetical protein
MNSQRGQAVLISLQITAECDRGNPARAFLCGALAQLGERLICIQEVIGSIPIGSTNHEVALTSGLRLRHMPQEGPRDLLAGRSPDGMWVGSSGG